MNRRQSDEQLGAGGTTPSLCASGPCASWQQGSAAPRGHRPWSRYCCPLPDSQVRPTSDSSKSSACFTSPTQLTGRCPHLEAAADTAMPSSLRRLRVTGVPEHCELRLSAETLRFRNNRAAPSQSTSHGNSRSRTVLSSVRVLASSSQLARAAPGRCFRPSRPVMRMLPSRSLRESWPELSRRRQRRHRCDTAASTCPLRCAG